VCHAHSPLPSDVLSRTRMLILALLR
jgi:hypothetical protein